MDPKEALLDEYRSLRAEILQNDQLIQRMSMFAFWAVVAPLAAFAYRPDRHELLFLAPAAYFVYQQMMTHKLEGTIRIATYIARFLEPAIAGLSWETRIRKLAVGLPGVPTHVALLFTATLGTVLPAVFFVEEPHRYGPIAFALAVYCYCQWQLVALKRLAGPDGFAKGWSEIDR